jgi:NB-ARC domain
MTDTQEKFEQAADEWNLENLYVDLAVAKTKVSLSSRSRDLTEVEKLHLRGLLGGDSPPEIADKLFKQAQGVQVDLCKTIYRYVEELTGRAVNSLDSWRNVVDWLEAEGYKVQPFSDRQSVVDWGEAPDSITFYGRSEELTILKQWVLHDRCRLVGLLGIGGIGKTALCVELAEQIQDEFECVVWRSLREAPLLNHLLPKLIQISPQTDTPTDSSQFLDYLRHHRCLIILDGIETLLNDYPVGSYPQEYEDYGELMKRVATERHQSCMLMTSREKPKEFVVLEGEKCPTRSLQLVGSYETTEEILREKGLDEHEKWKKLIQIYSGNPLAIKIVSTVIQDLFKGSVTEFLKQGIVFINNDLYGILDEQLVRLSDLEKEILYKIAVSSSLVSISELLESTSPLVSKSELIEVLHSLGRRSLIEENKLNSAVLFSLQPVIRKYVRTTNAVW